jgi:hypothetical protein
VLSSEQRLINTRINSARHRAEDIATLIDSIYKFTANIDASDQSEIIDLHSDANTLSRRLDRLQHDINSRWLDNES